MVGFRIIAVCGLMVLLDAEKVACATNDPSQAPINLPPSQDWDGIDGQWSSFALQLGTPPQDVKVLPSITGQSLWVVMPLACLESSGDTCVSTRGGIYAPNKSSTWKNQGNFELPLNPQHYLPVSGAANVGFEAVTLAWQDNGSTTLQDQVVNNYATEDFYIGVLGLSPLPINLSSFDDCHPSLVGALRDHDRLPGLSYGYTAGARYRSEAANSYGSLTLGGYDSTRMDAEKNLTIVGQSDTYRQFLVGVERIRSGENGLLDSPIVAGLDSLMSQIWLPISACEQFESAFGIVWDPALELYLVNESQHSSLVSNDPSIVFTLTNGGEQDKDDSLEIEFPYSAFDLIASPPLAGLNKSTHYFPLKRAANASQYTLGRTFLQQVYLIADYDRDAISLFPARFPAFGIEPILVPIDSPGNSLQESPTVAATDSKTSNKLPPATIVGIAVGSSLLLLLILAASCFVYQKRRKKAKRVTSELLIQQGSSRPVSDRTAPQNESKTLCRSRSIEEAMRLPEVIVHDWPSPFHLGSECSVQTSSFASLPWLQSPIELDDIEQHPPGQTHELP